MAVNRGLGVRQIGAIGTTPKEHRLALAGQYTENAPGTPRSGLLVQAAVNVVTPTATTGTMTYLVSEVAAVIARTVGEGVYTPTTVGATVANRTVATANSPATGSRWDLVWIKQNDQEKGDANNDAILGVTSGTATASPTKPTGSVPAGALILAEAQIFSGTTSTTQAPNTVSQVWRHTAARGAPILVRNVVERAEIASPIPGQEIIRLDLPSAPHEWWDTARSKWFGTRRHAEFTGAASPVGGADWGFGLFTEDLSAAGNNTFCVPGGNSRLTFTEPGVYSVHAKFGASSTPGFYYGAIKNSANTDVYADGDNGNGAAWGATVPHPGILIATAGTDILIGLKTAVSCTASIRLTVQKISD